MGGGVLGGGVMFLVIALLWGAVLVPAWFRRREFNAAERNALRLQRTLRVLAETSELPSEVRVEATAREALAHEKLLRTAQKRQEAEREAALAAAQAEQVRAEIRAQHMQRKQVAMRRAARLRTPIIRRLRSLAALVSFAGIVGALIGAGMMFAGVGPAILLWSLLAFAGGLGSLVLMAPGRAKHEPIAAERVIAADVSSESFDTAVATGETESSAEAHAAAQRTAAERIERARAMARAREARAAAPRVNQPDSMLLREVREQVAHTAGQVVQTATPQPSIEKQVASQVPKPAAQPRRVTGLSGMGVIGDTSDGMPDLDQVLRKRRSAG